MMAQPLPEVYTTREIARAAGVPDSKIRDLLARGEIDSVEHGLTAGVNPIWGRLVPHWEAVRVVRALRQGEPLEARDRSGLGRLLAPASERRTTTVPLIVSTSLHAVVASILLVLSSLNLTSADERTELLDPNPEPTRMVFLALPGPGGGGGGGGMRMPTPPPKAQRQGPRKMSSPIPARQLPPPPAPQPPKPEPPPPPLEAKTLPPVMAPVAPIAADTRNLEGVTREMPKETPPSQGAGAGGGAGSGQGTGLGEGTGAGIGPGEGGGIGGGPYRPGSGVSPPRLLKEVRADYTDQARRANLAGEVVLEIVVRRDGSVGDIRILRRLGSGLDQRAVDAVRQWQFAPARMKGVAVDVIVEVAVEFRLR